MLNRLIEPTAGQVLIDGDDIAKLDKQHLREVRRQKLSMAFQGFALLPNRTVLQNAAFGLEIQGMDKSEREAKANKALDLVGLAGLAINFLINYLAGCNNVSAWRARWPVMPRFSNGRGLFCA